MKTKQEIYTTVCNHLLTQMTQASTKGGDCQYRLETESHTLKCAIGGLIPDELYTPIIEGRSMFSIGPENRAIMSKGDQALISILKSIDIDTEDEDMMRFLNRLQKIHDNNAPDTWKEKLDELATTHNLTY